MSINEDVLINTLVKLSEENIIELTHSKTDAEITFIVPREDDKAINRVARIIEQQTQLRQKQIASVLNYVNNNNECKSKQLLSYFGENKTSNCGICSVCISLKKNTLENNTITKKEIIKCLEKGDLSSRALIEQLTFSEENTLNALQELLECNIINITKKNTYKLAHI